MSNGVLSFPKVGTVTLLNDKDRDTYKSRTKIRLGKYVKKDTVLDQLRLMSSSRKHLKT